ncbi:hypothetical protein Acy02nite_16740 [Actinoplanes cyaneus]|uniref:NodB homology domain-containing protein n=1 Tax=Actinoplanes cyaneus TaxID=52696 RepID=A0A919IHZ4_9ACTN|nr:Peptidoglycan/xylan/chitin deacetylase, PgdA/CDA1 family [Actinoplanes cyaneus]GID63793.1 hypothetical protein Acy02nite_16740 [Actinoplanes cyaneus]
MSDESRVTKPGEGPSEQAKDAGTPDEATVAIPAAGTADEVTEAIPADEPTTVIPADEPTAVVTADEPTATIPADEPTAAVRDENPADEATTVIPAGVGADEPTEAMTADSTSDETTTVMRAGTSSDEATTAIPVGTPPDEATIAISAADEATTPFRAVTPQEEATIAIPAAMASRSVPAQPAFAPVQPAPAPAPAQPGGSRLTRRRLILGLSGAAGVALTATAIAVNAGDDDSGKDAAKPTPAQPAVVTSRAPESATVTASPIPVQRKPISTLAEYAKATGGQAFPTDAIALTIDDGPHPIWTPKILQLLERYHVPAMFCMIGNQVLGHETVAKMVTGDGHQLANHTWSHPTKLGAKPSRVARKELQKAQAKISQTTGYVPKLFRSPGGDWSPQLLKDVAHAGLLPLDWSNDPRDWTTPGATTIEHRMLAAKPGQILLCHDGGGDRSQTYQALSVVIPALKARGLQFVAL